MNQAQASQAIFDRWIAAWPGLSSNVPYALDNTVIPEARPCAVVNIVSLESTQHTLGPRAKIRREGMIDVRIYGEVGEGRRGSDELVGFVRDVFERRRIGTGGAPAVGATRRVVTHAASQNELRRDQDSGGLWIVSVTIDFEYYDVRGS